MDWRRFLIANAAGGVVWACIFGLAAYTFGSALMQVTAPLATGLVLIAVIAIIAAVSCGRMRRNWRQKQNGRCQALYGPPIG